MIGAPYAAMTDSDRNRLIEEHLPLVHHVIGRLTLRLPATLDRDDLFATGVLGLMNAAATWNPTKGAAFKTHAFTAIRGAILDEIRKHDVVPRSRRDRVRHVARVERTLADRLGHAPTAEQIAEHACLDVEQVEDVLVNGHGATVVSLDAASDVDEDERPLMQCLATPTCEDPSDLAAKSELKGRLAAAIAELPERERRVIVLYYAEGLRLKEIGAVLGITESRVCQLHARALHQLNRALSSDAAEAG